MTAPMKQRKPIQRRKKPQAKAPWTTMPGMKLEKPVGENTPLRRYWESPVFKVRIKKRKPIKVRWVKKVSSSRAQELKQYYKRLPSWKHENPICQVEYCATPTKDCHHSRGKIHGLLLDERFWVPLCRHHHDKVKLNPVWARKEGILCQPGEWNTIPKESEA